MKNFKYLGMILTVIVVLVLTQNVFSSGVESIEPDAAYKLSLDGKAIIVDVRDETEIKAGKIKGAIEIPITLMNSDRAEFDKKINLLDKDKAVILYCRSGRRAGQVGEVVKKMGFNVFNLGGFDSWKTKQLPVE